MTADRRGGVSIPEANPRFEVGKILKQIRHAALPWAVAAVCGVGAYTIADSDQMKNLDAKIYAHQPLTSAETAENIALTSGLSILLITGGAAGAYGAGRYLFGKDSFLK